MGSRRTPGPGMGKTAEKGQTWMTGILSVKHSTVAKRDFPGGQCPK